MRATGWKALPGILVLALLAVCVTGCVVTARGHVDLPVVWVDEAHHGPLHDYYYYPGVDVYFDPSLSFYYWRDGDVWRHDRRAPRGIVLDSGHRRFFRSDAERPYDVHDRVQRFPAEDRREERRGAAEERRGAAEERRGERVEQRGEAAQERGAAVQQRGEAMGGKRGEAVERRGEAIQQRGERREERGQAVEKKGEEKKQEGEARKQEGEARKQEGEAVEK